MPALSAARGDDWTPERAERTATGLGIVLSPDHWRIIGCVRELSAARGRPPDLATLARRLGVLAWTIAKMFPCAPAQDSSLGSTLVAVAGVIPRAAASRRRRGRVSRARSTSKPLTR